MSVRVTPFHQRTAACNRENAWCERNGFTIPAHFGDADDESAAARVSVVVSDITWRTRVTVSGGRAASCLARLGTRDVSTLEIGTALKALWLNDAGAVRGAGVFARLGADEYQIVSAADDREWISDAAFIFGASATDSTHEQAGLALIGPYAARLLASAGIKASLEPLSAQRMRCGDLDVTLSRFGEHGGYEIWCSNDDALSVWDLILRTGSSFALQPAGSHAMDTLDLEAGVARPWRDFIPARDAFGTDPTPKSLGIESLIDPAHHDFNGHRSWSAGRGTAQHSVIAGVTIEGDIPVPFTPLVKDGQTVGRTLTSRYSPTLCRTIALADIETAQAMEGNTLSLLEPVTLERRKPTLIMARVTDLPFLLPPVSIAK